MKETIITLLGLQSYIQDRKIPKNIFYAQDDFSKNAEKLFTKDVDALSLIATLTTNNTNIPSLITDDEYYAELQVMYVTIRDTQCIDKVSTIIHQILPNPLLLIIQHESKVCLTISQKRRNKADKSKQVIEDIYTTGRLDPHSHEGFRKDMHYQSHVFTNLKRFYEGWFYPILIMQYHYLWGGYRSLSLDMMPQILDIISQYQSLQKQIDSLESTYKQTISMGEQTKLYMQIKSFKEQQQKLITTL